jgi:hypothetical protein
LFFQKISVLSRVELAPKPEGEKQTVRSTKRWGMERGLSQENVIKLEIKNAI